MLNASRVYKSLRNRFEQYVNGYALSIAAWCDAVGRVTQFFRSEAFVLSNIPALMFFDDSDTLQRPNEEQCSNISLHDEFEVEKIDQSYIENDIDIDNTIARVTNTARNAASAAALDTASTII